jgi:hypothetical protein
MEEASMLKRTLVMTSWLVGAFTVWVALVSLVAVTLAGRAMSGFEVRRDQSGTVSDGAPAESANPSTRASAHPTTARAPRPNG